MEVKHFSRGRQFIVAAFFISEVEDDGETPLILNTNLTRNRLLN